jgi:hypothetical protein
MWKDTVSDRSSISRPFLHDSLETSKIMPLQARKPKVSAAYSEKEVLRALCKASFYDFVRTFWPVLSSEKPVWNWHVRYLCGKVQLMMENLFRGEKKLYDLCVNIPPGTTKPVWEGMKVMMADGTYKRLRDIKVGDSVVGKSGRVCRVQAVHVQGELPCVVLRTKGGRKIVAALDHPVLTADGWVEAGKVLPGQRLALRHNPKLEVASDHKDDEFAVAGYLIGDGSLKGNFCFTNSDPTYLRDFMTCLDRLGYGYRVRKCRTPGGKTYSVFPRGRGSHGGKKDNFDPQVTGRGRYRRSGPRQWAKDVGLTGMSSRDKRVPEFVWKGTDAQVARFLAAYFHCDGHVTTSAAKRNHGLRMVTISKGLAKDLQRLFLRLGVRMNIRWCVAERGFPYNRGLVGYESYLLTAASLEDVARFANTIPLTSRKGRRLRGTPNFAFQSDYLADEVTEVKTLKVPRPCRCLTVERDSSFCVDGVVVHNSTILSIMLPAWAWTRMPEFQFIGASYSGEVAMDLSMKTRNVVRSELYQELFPEIRWRTDQDTKHYFMNEAGGWRFAVGVKGDVTSRHAHVIGIDDPLNPEESYSDADIATSNRWIRETLRTRKVSKTRSFTILVMQRLHQDDPTAQFVTRKKVFWVCLPAELTKDVRPRKLRSKYKNGLLDPVRMPKEVLEEEEAQGSFYYAAQFLQTPVPRGGAMFEVDKMLVRTDCPEHFKALARAWPTRMLNLEIPLGEPSLQPWVESYNPSSLDCGSSLPFKFPGL